MDISHAWVWFATYVLPWLVSSALPSIITGLRNEPQVAGIMSKILFFMSFLTYKDQPGTFQNPPVMGMMKRQGKKAMALALAVTTASSCAYFKAHPKVLNCATDAVAQALPGVIGAVVEALQPNEGPDWSALAVLEGKYGLDMIICAVQALMPDAEKHAAHSTQAAAVARNGRKYLAKHGM